MRGMLPAEGWRASRSLRVYLVSFALIALPLGALAGAGLTVVLRELARSRETATQSASGAVAMAVGDVERALRREAVLLARDPALIDGVSKRDWATLARLASPRIPAATRDGVADLVVVRAADGVPLLQVPAVPPQGVPSFLGLAEPVVTIRLVDGRPVLLAASPIRSLDATAPAAGAPLGVVVVGRSVAGLAPLLDGAPARPAVVFLAGDRALASTRPDAPASGWNRARESGRVVAGSETFALRPLPAATADSPDGTLWALVPEPPLRVGPWKLGAWLAALGAIAAAVLGIGLWVLLDRLRDDGTHPKRLSERRARELEAVTQALVQVAALVGSTLDAERVLDVIVDRCRALMGVAAAGIFRLDAETGVLRYERGIGLSAEFVSALRVSLGEGTTGRAVHDRAPAWTADIKADAAVRLAPETRDLVEREGYRAVLSVPILGAPGPPRGALSAYWWEPHAPGAAEIELMSALAGQAAVALENARLYGEAAQQAERMRAVADLGRALVSTLDANRILEMVATQARGTLDVSHVGICLEEPGTGRLRFVEDASRAGRFIGGPVLEPGEGISGRAVAERRPVWTADILRDPLVELSPAARQQLEAAGTRAVLALPLVRERALGALVVHREAGHRFSEAEIQYLSIFAGQVAVALDNARLYSALDVRASRLRTLARLSRAVSSSLDPGAVLDAIVRAAAEIMSSAFVCVYVADEPGRTLELQAASDQRIGGALPGGRRRFGLGLVGWVAEHRQALSVPDIQADERSTDAAWARQHGLSSFLGVPIVFQGSLLGVLALVDPAPLALGAEDEALLESFVSQAAVAIRNTRLHAETTRHLEETRALLEVAEILNSTLDPQRVLKQVAIKIAQVCRVDRCSIERWDGDRAIPLMSQFADGRRDDPMWRAFMTTPGPPPRQVPAHARAIETRRPVVITDTATSDLIPREWTLAFGHKSSMVAPLVRHESVIGMMTLDYVERVTPFEPWQIDLAAAIAAQLALTIENTRLYGEVQERLRETSTLLAVGRVLSQPGPGGEVMRQTAREVARAFGADMAGVYVLDAARETLVPVAGYHVPRRLLSVFQERSYVLARFPALTETWRSGRAFWSADVKNDPRLDADSFAGVESHSVLFAPTMVRGEAVGALFLVWWDVGRAFDPAEVRLIEGVASQLGLATENAELARQTQQKLEETERLLAVGRTLASTLDLDTLPRQFLRHVVRALGADCAGMWLIDESGERMEALAGYHIPPGQLDTLRRLRVSLATDTLYAEAVRSRRPGVSTEAMDDPRIPKALRDAAPHRTQLFVPIVAKDRVLGGFAIVWWEARRGLAESELRLMEAIASQAGVALDNARLFRDNQRRVDELSVLHELSRAVTGQLDQDGLLATIHRHLVRLLDARDLAILLHDQSSDGLDVALRVTDGARRDGEPRRYPRAGVGLAGLVFETGRPIRTAEYAEECARRLVQPEPGSEGLPNWLGVPMAAANRPLGVLSLRSRERAFTESDQRLLANIADLAALALRSARLYEERTRAHHELAAAQDQLVRTEKLRAMGEMASGVAHDFNNVLAAILGRAQLLRKRVQDPKLGQWIEVIERSALDGARTVRRLQEFTRIRRDQPVVAVNLNEVVRHSLEATESVWRQEARSRGVHIDVATRLAPTLPEVSGDPAELREALTNLILNALDAMPGGGALTLATSLGDREVQVAVSDTGAGIPVEIRDKIFDPFFTTKGPKGTGLGLSMTYGILSRHGGRISVESEEGVGTTFRLSFPVVASADETVEEPAAQRAVAAALRCLVVDDEAVVAGVLGDMLAAAGHRVEVVSSGRTAVDRFDAERFDLVLTDLAMPGMTGWEVARAIKHVEPAARVVLVSGFGVELSPEDLRANGVDLVLSKPVKFEDIESAVALARAGRDE
jgi:GAF domain-containing protein/ActR/RegA family two-component response regulator